VAVACSRRAGFRAVVALRWLRGGQRRECRECSAAPARFSGAGLWRRSFVFFLPGVSRLAGFLWLRTMSRVVVNASAGPVPIRRQPAAADVVAGRGSFAVAKQFGSGAAGVGAAVRGGRVVVFLLRSWRARPGNGDRLLGEHAWDAAGGCRISGRSPVQGIERRRRAADLPGRQGRRRGGSRRRRPG